MNKIEKINRFEKLFIKKGNNKSGKKISKWYLVGRSLKYDLEFNKESDCLLYVKENYENVDVLVQNDLGQWSYEIKMRNQNIIDARAPKNQKIDDKTKKIMQKIFKYYFERESNEREAEFTGKDATSTKTNKKLNILFLVLMIFAILQTAVAIALIF